MSTISIEIIDLTEDNSTNAPTIPNFGVAATVNHNLHLVIHPSQAAQWHASHTYDPSTVATRFHHFIHVGQVTIILEPVPESNILFFPNGVRLKEPWTLREHGIVSFNLNLIYFLFQFSHSSFMLTALIFTLDTLQSVDKCYKHYYILLLISFIL